MDIDLVYLWVDGSDPVWLAKKNAFMYGAPMVSHEATNESRFINNDELRYSLRSIELYAPWIRHIYIVTDGQVPSWLNLNNPRVSIVDHKEIMPPSALPTFSSPAIEWCVDNIPGLSEYFLLANDDTFVAEGVEPGFFFNEKGYPIVRLKKWSSRKLDRSQYLKTVGKAQRLVRQYFGKHIKHIPHHNIDAYRKSDLKTCKEYFAKEVDETINRHVRDDNDLQRVVALYYAVANGVAEVKLMGRYNKEMSLFDKIRCSLRGIYHYDTRCINIEEDTDFQRVMDRYNPTLFCINDNEKANEASRLRAREFLMRMFPDKSSFER